MSRLDTEKYQSLGRLNYTGRLTTTGSNGNQVELKVRRWDSSLSSYEDVSPVFKATLSAAGRVENMPFLSIVENVTEGDRLEVWVRNTTASSNITAEEGGYFIVSERGS